MQNIYQKTISEIVEFKGIGLHSGEASKIKIYPAKENRELYLKEQI